MKKRILALLLVVTLLLPMLALSASARTTTVRVKGVDYDRIEENTMLKKDVLLSIGGMHFRGDLQNGKRLTEKEVDDIIRRIMGYMDLDSLKLLEAEACIRQVKEEDGVDMELLQELGLKFLLGATGVSNITDIYDLMIGEKELAEGVADMAYGQLVSYTSQLAYGKIVSMLISGLYNCKDSAIRELVTLLTKDERLQLAMAYTVMLNTFYRRCNSAIAREELEKGGSTWSIEFLSTTYKNTTLFGIPVKQFWKATGELKREYVYGKEEDPTNFGGVFRGDLQIEIWHDLSNFDKQLLNSLLLKFPHIAGFQAILYWRDQYQASDLRKRLTNTQPVEVHLDMNNMTSSGMTEYIELNGFEDVSYFSLAHHLEGPVDFGPYKNGKWVASYPTENGTVHVNLTNQFRMEFSGAMSGNNRYPRLIYNVFQKVDSGTVIAPRVGNVYIPYPITNTVDIDLVTDYKIYEDLSSGSASLTVPGR